MTTQAPAPPGAPSPAPDRTFTPVPRPRRTPARAASVFLSTHPRTRLALLLSAPLFWLGVVYIVALVLLLVTAFWTVDSFTGEISQEWTLDNIITVLTGSLYQTVSTVMMLSSVHSWLISPVKLSTVQNAVTSSSTRATM